MATTAKPLNRLHFSIEIDAPREKVWQTLWDDASYRDWTSVFAEGSYAVGDWQERSTMKFIDPASNAGMSAVIEKRREPEFMSIRHEAEIKDGQVQGPVDWTGAHENYTLTAQNGRTTLAVDLDTPDEYRKMFEDKFPRALQRVKKLAESR